MRSSQQRIKDLEARFITQQTDLSACDSEIARLNLRIEEAARAKCRKQSELTSAVNKVASQDAEIAELQSRIEEAERANRYKQRELIITTELLESQDAKIADLRSRLARAALVAQYDKRIIEKPRKTRMRPTVSTHLAFCYFRSRY